MDAIDIVNTELKKFCDQHDNLEYFDAYDIFVQDDQEGKHEGKILSQALMDDFLHPTSEGYRLWGSQILLRLRKIIDGSLIVYRLK